MASKHETPTIEEAYRDHHRRVFLVCFRITRDHGRAEDLTQDVFLHLCKVLHTFHGESSFSTWLHRVAVNEALGSLRKVRRRPEVSLDAMEDDAALGECPDFHVAVTARDGKLESTPERIALAGAIKRLSPSCRAALTLRLVDGYPFGEIAQMLSMSVAGAKSRVSRAKRAIRGHMAA